MGPRLPFQDRPGWLRRRAEREEYEADVEARFWTGQVLDLSAVMGCWSGMFAGAEDVLAALGKD